MSIKCIIRQINALDETKESLYPEVVHAATIREDEFVEMVCRNRGLEPAQVKAVLSGVSRTAGTLLSLGHRVKIEGLGSLSVSVKGDLEQDGRGVIQLKNAALKTIKITPARKLLREAAPCGFSLLSHEPQVRATADPDAACAAAGALLGQKPYFVSSEFQEEAGVSRSLAKKLLTALEQDGIVRKHRSGGSNIWTAVG